MNQEKTIKRFVAGTRCPECQQQDTTVSYFEAEEMVRECIECGFLEKMSEALEKEAQESEPQPIKIKQL